MTKQMTAEFETTEGMSPECAAGLRQVLMGCADSKLLLGFHYGEWTFGTPELEAAVASCSLAQAELGHVRLLHAVLNKPSPTPTWGSWTGRSRIGQASSP